MKEITLQNLPLGASGYIDRCLAPMRDDIYRLLEMGLYPGAKFTILHKTKGLKAMELALEGSRLCIALELASEFLVTSGINNK